MKTTLRSVVLLSALLPSLALAQASRTWVSGVGDDANPGSRTAPCRTFAGAIFKTTANGVISVLDPGSFGPVTITKSITIDGGGIEAGILTSGTSGIIINAGTNGVVILRNLTLEGLGNSLSGIRVLSARAVHIEKCRINGYEQSAIQFTCSVTNSQLFIKDTVIHHCAPVGIALLPAVPATVLIEGANVTACENGVHVGPKIKATILDTTASGNEGAGFLVSAGGRMTLVRGTATDNLIGVQSSGMATISDSSVIFNEDNGLQTGGTGKIRSFLNSTVAGNSPNGTNSAVLKLW